MRRNKNPGTSKSRIRAVLDRTINDLNARRRWTILTTVWPSIDHIVMAYTGFCMDLVPPGQPGARTHMHEVVSIFCTKLDSFDREMFLKNGDLPTYLTVIQTLFDQAAHLATVRAVNPRSPSKVWDVTKGPIIEFTNGGSVKPKFKRAADNDDLSVVSVKQALFEGLFNKSQKAFVSDILPDLLAA